MSLEDIPQEGRDELALIYKTLADHPETRKDILKLTKKVRPDLPIPELEIEERTSQANLELRKEIEMLRNDAMERDAREKLNSRRSTLKQKGLASSDEDIDQIEKVMIEQQIPNHETAAQYWQWMKQSATPTPTTTYNPSPLNGMNLNNFWKNPVRGAREEAAKALMDLRKPTRPIGL
jgi:hypothetical protein